MRSLVRGPEGQISEAAVDRPAQDLITVSCPDFDLSLTLKSGQVFRWAVLGGGSFGGWIDDSFARVSQEGNRLLVRRVSADSARRFFSLDADLPAIVRQVDVDPFIHEALRCYPGLRVLRQDPWECTASFLLSAFNNIPRLTGMLETLAGRFGRYLAPTREWVRSPSVRAVGRISWLKNAARTSKLTHPSPGRVLSTRLSQPGSGAGARASRRPSGHGSPVSFISGESEAEREAGRPGGAAEPSRANAPDLQAGEMRVSDAFPRPEKLAEISERALRNCGLGYRAPYLKAVAKKVAAGEVNLEKLRDLGDEELRRALLTLPGIGEKVVECVMLFAYGRGAAFPVDVWIGRAMRGWYFKRRKVSDRKIREFARKHFGPHCGWAQQVLYCLARWQSDDPSV